MKLPLITRKRHEREINALWTIIRNMTNESRLAIEQIIAAHKPAPTRSHEEINDILDLLEDKYEGNSVKASYELNISENTLRYWRRKRRLGLIK